MRLAPSSLVEREHELATLECAVETGGAALVLGPFGSGKSALLAAVRALATERGARVLEARAADAERDFAYGVVRQLVEVALADERGRVEAVLSGDGLLTLLAGLGGVCVLVDDVQCADPPSLAALAHVAGRLEGSRIAIVAAGEPPVAGLEGWAELRPAPLSEDGVRAVLGPDATDAAVRACHEATAGVPFLLDQVVAELRRARRGPDAAAIAEVVERPPPAVGRMVAGRLRALGDDAEAVARAVAVLGDSVGAAALAGLDDRRVAAALERLEDAGLPQAPLVRAAVYEGIPVSARSQLHAQAATVLSGAPPSVLARHVVHAPQHAVPGAAAVLAAAVADAQPRGELPAVARYLRRRVDESGAADAAVAMLGSVELRLGRIDAAAACLTRALEVVREPDDRFRAIAELGTALVYQDRAVEAMELLEPAVAAAREAGSDTAHVLEATQAVAGWSDHGVFRRLRRSLPVMRDAAVAPATDGEHVRLGRIAAEHAMHGSAHDARRVAALGSGDRLGDGRHLVVFHLRELALVLADDPGVLAALTGVEGQARRLGSSVALDIVRGHRVTARLRRGELDALAHEAEPAVGSFGTVAVAEGLMERGDLAGAADALERSRRPDLGWRVDLFRLLALGRLERRLGRLPDALASFEKCARVEARWGFTEPLNASWRTEAALAHHAGGVAQAARALALESVERTRRYGSERLQGMALAAAAHVGAAEPADALPAAIELLDRAQARVEAARARVELAGLLRRGGQPRLARTPLREAAELAAGATELERRIVRELELAGEGPGARRGGRGSDELTAAERRAAELAAEGLTNREIAAALRLAEKTVETQLSRVYRKLGIRSRHELRRARP